MKIDQVVHTKFTTLRIQGELDALSSVGADEVFTQLIQQKQFNLHLDFSQLEYISSAGIGVILSHQDEIYQNKGKIVFSGLSPKVLNVFQLLGLNQLFKIVSTESEVEGCFSES
jgi:anti-sigma B factor antagonist